MKHSALYILLLSTLLSCGPGKEDPVKGKGNNIFPVEYHYEQLQGIYSGDFGSGTIYLNLCLATGRNATGYSMKKGVKRNFSGPMEQKDNGFHFALKEPGNNPSDGVFDIYIDTATRTAKGRWLPGANSKLAAISFSLTKKENRSYDGAGVVFSDSLNQLFFKENGQCTYEFYAQDSSGHEARQMTVAKGNWRCSNGVYTIEWEDDKVFASGTSTIAIDSVKGDSASAYYSHILRFNGRILEKEDY